MELVPKSKINEMIDEGYSEKEVSEFLASELNLTDQLDQVLENDYSYSNFLDYVSGKESQDYSSTTRLGAVGSGATSGLVDLTSAILGAPADLGATVIEEAVDAPYQVYKRLTTPMSEKEEMFKRGEFEFPKVFEFEKPFLGSDYISEKIRSGYDASDFPIAEKKDLPVSLRPYYTGGETFSTGLGILGAPYAAVRNPKRVSNFLQPLVERAISSPKSYFASEIPALTGASVAGGVAEKTFPDNPYARIGAEVTAGLLNPMQYATSLVNKFTRSPKTNIQDKASEVAQSFVTSRGESPSDVAKILESPDVSGVNLTPAMRTESQGLLDLEGYVSKLSPNFSEARDSLTAKSLSNLQEGIQKSTTQGKPELITQASRQRFQDINNNLDMMVANFENAALDARSNITSLTSKDKIEKSLNAVKLMRSSLKNARDQENILWNQVDKDVILPPQLITNVRDAIKRTALKSEPLPPLVSRELKRMKKEGVLSGDALKFRSELLSEARQARGKGDFIVATRYNEAASEILDSVIDMMPRSEEVLQATEYSNKLHNVFTRSFAGKSSSRGRLGEERISPETMLEKAYGQGGTQAKVQFGELSKAAKMGDEAVAGNLSSKLAEESEAFLSIVSKDLLDESGQVTSNKINNFLSKNESLLNDFPSLRQKLLNVKNVNQELKRISSDAKTARQIINSRTIFGNVLKTDSPEVVVKNVMKSDNFTRDYTQLAKMAKRGGEDAVLGLKSLTMKNMFDASLDKTGLLDFQKLKNLMSKGFSKEERGVLNLMSRNNLIDNSSIKYLEELTDRGLAIQKIKNRPRPITEDLPNDFLSDALERLAGVKLGQAVGKATASQNSLMLASAGVRFVKKGSNFFKKIPIKATQDLLVNAASDPKLMRMLLLRPKSLNQQMALERNIKAYLLSSGINFDKEQ